MSETPVPYNAVGRVGLVARLRRVRPMDLGRRVVVRSQIGPVTSTERGWPALFAWHVRLLDGPTDLGGRPRREIVVADACLEPAGMTDSRLADQDAAALDCDELGLRFGERPALDTTLHLPHEAYLAHIAGAVDGVGLVEWLEVIPTPQALQVLGFRPVDAAGGDGGEDSRVWTWSTSWRGAELFVLGCPCPDASGRWVLTARCNRPREAMWDERLFRGEGPLGEVALTMLGFWRAAHGRNAPVPAPLRQALAYEQHRRDMQRVLGSRAGLATLGVDGESLRAVRRRLARERAEHGWMGPLPDAPLGLSWREGMLCLRAGGQVHGCPAEGVWLDDCTVSLAAFVALPVARLRGPRVHVERSGASLALGGGDVPVLGEGPAK